MRTWWIYLNQKANRWQCKTAPHRYSTGEMIDGQLQVFSKDEVEEIIANLSQEIDNLKNKLALHSQAPEMRQQY